MKKIIIMAVAAILLAAPASVAQKPRKAATEKEAKADKDVCTVTFATNLTCQNCVKKVNENISFERGVKDLDVSLKEERITVKYDKRKTNEENLAAAIRKLGYKAEKVK